MPPPAERLRDLIVETGPVPFARFMEEALYGRGGYYARERLEIGREGDFVTGSSFSPLFGRATAAVLAKLGRILGGPVELLEAGYGTGAHLVAVAEALEGSRAFGLLGWDRVPRPLPPRGGPPRLESLETLEEVGPGRIQGMIFSYELFDALPFHRLIGRSPSGPRSGPGELLVELRQDGRFGWIEGELSRGELVELLAHEVLRPGQVADLSPAWRPLYRRLAERLGRGLLVTCDYGFERRRLLDHRIRPHGTLACHRRHRVHRNPFVHIGDQDLSAHVDFSALMEEGEAAGLTTVTLTRQARWLTACGMFDGLRGASTEDRIEAMTLLDPAGMGEEIRVLVQAREVDVEALFDLEILG